MKTFPSTLPVPLVVCFGIMICSLRTAGQSAEGFDTSDLAQGEPVPAAETPKAVAVPVPANHEIVPSRYAGDEIATYVSTLAVRLSIAKRETDAFGRYQDPDRKVPEPKILNNSPNQRQFKAEPPAPFSDIVAMLSVKLVNTAKQQFLIGDRMFKVNDMFPIQLTSNGKKYKVQVLSVTKTRIVFRNLETGETGNLGLDMIPAGMRKGNGGIRVPGVQIASEDFPIEVQPPIPLSTNP